MPRTRPRAGTMEDQDAQLLKTMVEDLQGAIEEGAEVAKALAAELRRARNAPPQPPAHGHGPHGLGDYRRWVLGLVTAVIIGLFGWIWTIDRTVTALPSAKDFSNLRDAVQANSLDLTRIEQQVRDHLRQQP